MLDSCGRNLSYLRVSITDRCNLRCYYCMPEQGVSFTPHEEILSFEEILRVVKIMASLGVHRVRLTGGEPLVRSGILSLVEEIKKISNINYLAMTTNATLLEQYVEDLKTAGLDGINISLDTLNSQHYTEITRGGNLEEALEGLDAALNSGLRVKLNCVLSPDSTMEEWLEIANLAKHNPMDVRFIEWMPFTTLSTANPLVTQTELLNFFEQSYGKANPVAHNPTEGPARYWNFENFTGKIGVISAMSHNFCSSCNRLRLTSTGDLKLCLFYDRGISLKPLLRGNVKDETISRQIQQAILSKPEKHHGTVDIQENDSPSKIETVEGLYNTGG